MREVDAGLIRYVAQHRTHMNDPLWRMRFLQLLELDEEHDAEIIQAIEQFLSDIACHVLERLVT